MTAAEQELEKLMAEKNRLYWLFTRCARAKPVPAEIFRRIHELEEQVRQEKAIGMTPELAACVVPDLPEETKKAVLTTGFRPPGGKDRT